MMYFNFDHDLAQRNQFDRLKEAEKWRLVKMAEAASTTKPKRKWSLSFRLKRQVAPKAALANSK
jgi:hypothetical protein